MKIEFRWKSVIMCVALMMMVLCIDETVWATGEATGDGNTTTHDETLGDTQDAKEDTSTLVDEIKNGWNENKTQYYVNDKAVTGVYVINKKLYYFNSEGRLYRKKGLRKINGSYYYVNKDYSLKTGVVKVKKNYYYFQKKTGQRYEKTGIRKVDGQYYFFSSQHTLKSGWKRNDENVRYYFDKKTFAAKTGWQYVGKYKYYFKKNGQLVQDVRDLLTKQQKKSYYIEVNRTACCVTVYAQDGSKGYTIPVVAFICSTGGATPVGNVKIRDKLRWHTLIGPCWGQWCCHLTDTILFHSVFYNKPYDKYSLSVSAYNKLGTMASHGCVRLTAGDAKWIYDNCAVGTKVKIYNNEKDPGPFDKPKAQKLDANHTWDPTDPTVKK